MSRLGKKPIAIPKGAEVTIEEEVIKVKGPKGELKQALHPLVKIEKIKDEELGDAIKLSVKDPENKKQKAFWGLYASLVKNMFKGVLEGYEKKLEINGVGYKVALSGKKLVLNVGYSHPVEFTLPEGISGQVEANVITVSGIDKQLVGETAARIRKIRKPEPFKGKGIKYVGELLRRKAGKAAKSGE